MTMFKVPVERRDDTKVVSLVFALNNLVKQMTSFEINFWIVWLEKYLDCSAKEVLTTLMRDSTMVDEMEKEIQAIKKEYGIKDISKVKKDLSKDETLKISKERRVDDPLKYNKRVMVKVESFYNIDECIVWANKIGRNKFSTDVVKQFLELGNWRLKECFEVSMLKWFLGEVGDVEILRILSEASFRGAKQVLDIIERNNA